MPSSSSCRTAMRWAAARCTFASATGSAWRLGASERKDTLLDLRARRDNDLLPLGRLVADHLAEIIGRPGDRGAAQLRGRGPAAAAGSARPAPPAAPRRCDGPGPPVGPTDPSRLAAG